jgi:hypothetical protein
VGVLIGVPGVLDDPAAEVLALARQPVHRSEFLPRHLDAVSRCPACLVARGWQPSPEVAGAD